MRTPLISWMRKWLRRVFFPPPTPHLFTEPLSRPGDERRPQTRRLSRSRCGRRSSPGRESGSDDFFLLTPTLSLEQRKCLCRRCTFQAIRIWGIQNNRHSPASGEGSGEEDGPTATAPPRLGNRRSPTRMTSSTSPTADCVMEGGKLPALGLERLVSAATVI